jgi:hypothetical protein
MCAKLVARLQSHVVQPSEEEQTRARNDDVEEKWALSKDVAGAYLGWSCVAQLDLPPLRVELRTSSNTYASVSLSQQDPMIALSCIAKQPHRKRTTKTGRRVNTLFTRISLACRKDYRQAAMLIS